MLHHQRVNFLLIDQHEEYIRKWKEDRIEQTLRDFRRMQTITPTVYAVGYNYSKNMYEEAYFPVELEVMDNIDTKIQMCAFVHNLDKYLPCHVLAVIFATPMVVTALAGDEQVAILLLFETKLFTTRYAYRMVPAISESGPVLELELDDTLMSAKLGPEVSVMESMFPLQNSLN